MVCLSRPEDKRRLLDAFELDVNGSPIVIVPCLGSKHPFNVEEANATKIICAWLMGKGFLNKEIGIICYFREQEGILEQYARETGIPLYIAEEVARASFEVSIILPTKKPLNTDPIINERRRLYTALTRSNHGVFILTDTEVLEGNNAEYGHKLI